MEHDTGSGGDPAATSSMPDQQLPPQSSESGDESSGTGEPMVDAALSGLDELAELPVSEHPGVYERIHEQLVEVLGELHPGTQGR